jgi:hypothetical protein
MIFCIGAQTKQIFIIPGDFSWQKFPITLIFSTCMERLAPGFDNHVNIFVVAPVADLVGRHVAFRISRSQKVNYHNLCHPELVYRCPATMADHTFDAYLHVSRGLTS